MDDASNEPIAEKLEFIFNFFRTVPGTVRFYAHFLVIRHFVIIINGLPACVHSLCAKLARASH